MQKLLIYWALGASLTLVGCSTVKEWGDAITPSVDQVPLMYRPHIQQGNIISQETVNQLRPGMAKRQVRYLMGTPILVDIFHQDRWDYIYADKPNAELREQRRITLFFENDVLTRIEGDFRPMPVADPLANKPESVVSVPDYKGPEKGFFSRTLEKIGVKEED
jgi:outer membrane protein assembly factor BamE